MTMGANEKWCRRMARRSGKQARVAILNAAYPVYENDPEYWERAAAMLAREATRWAHMSLVAREVEQP